MSADDPYVHLFAHEAMPGMFLVTTAGDMVELDAVTVVGEIAILSIVGTGEKWWLPAGTAIRRMP